MNRYWIFSVCIAALLLAVYAEELDVGIPTKCPQVDSSDTVVLLAHEYDCTKFYMCLGGQKVLQVCAPMDQLGNLLHFNPKKQTCDWPSESGCKNNAISTNGGTTEDVISPSTEWSTTTVTSTEQSTTQGTTAPSTESSTTTKTSTEPSTTRGTTAPSTEWSTTTVTSTEQSTTQGTTAPSTESSTTTKTSTEPSTTRGTTAPSTEWSTTTVTSTEQSTTQGTTAPSTEWSTTTVTSTEPSTTEDSSSTEDVSAVTEGTTNEPNTIHPEDLKQCPSDGSMNGMFYPHKSSCRKYYICFDSWLNLHECPEGEHFNLRYNHCDKPENVGCSEATSTTVSPTTASPTTEPTTTEFPSITPEIILTKCPKKDSAAPIHIPHPTNCVSYYKCVKGKKILEKCPRGYHFNPKLQKCDWPEKAGCYPQRFECPQDRIILIAHETNSTLYYECNNGGKELKKCLEGLEFDPVLAICDFPEQTHSQKIMTSVIILNSDVLDALVESRDQELYDSRDEELDEETDKCIGECPPVDSVDVVYLAHEECTKFCKCSFGEPYLFVCPHHLHFNPEKQICDHPYAAGCESQQD